MSSYILRSLVSLCVCLAVSGAAVCSSAADESDPLFNPLAGISGVLGSPVQISADIESPGDGGPDVLAVTAVLEDGWHLYSLQQGKGASKPGGPKATVIRVAEDSSQLPVGEFRPDVQPERREAEGVPSWKVTPSRSVNVTVLASSELSHAVARPGTKDPSAARTTNGSVMKEFISITYKLRVL